MTNATITTTGTRVRVVLVDPPFAYGREAVVEMPNGERARVPFQALAMDADRRMPVFREMDGTPKW